MRVGIVAIAKGEDLYLKEWIDWHLGLGFSQIMIALNDDEFKPQVVNPKVIYEDYHGVESVQTIAYRKLYKKYQKDFDWILFIDIDEFLVLDGFSTVQDFLKDYDCDIVRLSCKHFTDGDMLDTDGDYRVMERFTEPIAVDEDRFVKSFINTRVSVKGRKICGHGIYVDDLEARDALGNRCDNVAHRLSYVLHERAWINHYRTKTIAEYIRQKYMRGGANRNPERYSNWESYFFRTNRKTQEKLDYANKLIKRLYNDK